MLSGKPVLITGASSRIGLALALGEANLYLSGRNEVALGEVARQVRSWGALRSTRSS